MISSEAPHANIHGFIDSPGKEDSCQAFEELAESQLVNQYQQNSSPECQVFEIDSNGQEKKGFWDIREVKLD